MMKISKRLTAVLLSVLAACMILPMSVLAAGSIDLNKDVSLTISYRDGDTPLVGAEFDVYLVATVDEYGELTTTETFQQFNVDIRGKMRPGGNWQLHWKDMFCGIRFRRLTVGRRM